MNEISQLREHARAIWQAAVAAADPFALVRTALTEPHTPLRTAVEAAERIVVVGGGKAGAAMAAGGEAGLADRLDRVTGVVNVPRETVRPLRKIELHAARPAGVNHPTAEGVAGVERILELVRHAGANDLCLCLLSGGGSALLPAPAEGVTLEDKQHVTKLLHACGATIDEMNCVRKHLSRVKGGRLAQAFPPVEDGRRALYSLIISDVVGDPLDVIASGPTAADPTTFADALAVLERFGLRGEAPWNVVAHLDAGAAGKFPETLKELPPHVHNLILGNNSKALAASQRVAESLGYRVLNLGAFIEGDTQQAATVLAGIVRSIRVDGQPLAPPVCVLSGGETTVTLPPGHGRGGRNQEFVLAALHKLGAEGMRGVVILSGGTDGEDGPTDAAGAIADEETSQRARQRGLSAEEHLRRHDAYAFFGATCDLLKTGLTQTNVMDVRIMLIARPPEKTRRLSPHGS
jgi:hydroxypyruvate reductase/glycerate 2-kinase